MAPRWASRVLTASFQDGVQELVFAFQVAEVVAGRNRARSCSPARAAAVAVQGQVLDGLVPAAGRGRLDHQAVGGQVADLGVAAVGQDIDHHGDVAAADDVVGPQRPFAGPELGAVQVGAVGAARSLTRQPLGVARISA